MNDMKLNNPIISIIVPVFNAENYLVPCIDSLINQTFQDIEIICINDGSTDNSASILNDYAKNDKRVRVFSQKNAGLSASRNNAFQYVSGEYLMYLDSDDWFDLDACELLLASIRSEKADVVMFPYMREYEKKSLHKYIYNKEVVLYNEHECKELHRRHIGLINIELSNPQDMDALCSSSTKLYKTSIIRENKLQFVDLKIIGTFNDGLFNIHYFKYVKKAVYINKYLFHFRKTNINSITTVYNSKLVDQWDSLYDIIDRYIHDNALNNYFSDGLKNRIAVSIIGLGINLVASNMTFSKKVKTIDKIIRKPNYNLAFKQLELKYLKPHWMIFFGLCKCRFSFGVIILLSLMNRLRKII